MSNSEIFLTYWFVLLNNCQNIHDIYYLFFKWNLESYMFCTNLVADNLFSNENIWKINLNFNYTLQSTRWNILSKKDNVNLLILKKLNLSFYFIFFYLEWE